VNASISLRRTPSDALHPGLWTRDRMVTIVTPVPPPPPLVGAPAPNPTTRSIGHQAMSTFKIAAFPFRQRCYLHK